MIYKLGETYIDISKLEYISNIIEENIVKGRYYYYFELQVNGCVYNSPSYCDKNISLKLRKELIKQWQIVMCHKNRNI